MKKFHGLLLFILFTDTLFSQEIVKNKMNFGFDLGLAAYTLSDKSLNYYTYNANSFVPLNFHCYFLGEKNIHFINLNFIASTFQTSEESNLYQYNKINLYDGKLNYEYYRLIKPFNNSFQFFLGASYNLYITRYNEYYQSKFWPYQNSQFSYDESMNISLNFLLNYKIKRSNFIIKGGYAFLNYGTRPDDFYIKFGSQNSSVWKFYSVNNYKNIQISLISHFDISNYFSLKFEYLSDFRTYITDNEFRFLKQSWLCGVSYKF